MDKVDKDHLPMPLSNFRTSLSQATKMLNSVFGFNSSLKHFSVEGTETFLGGGGGWGESVGILYYDMCYKNSFSFIFIGKLRAGTANLCQ